MGLQSVYVVLSWRGGQCGTMLLCPCMHVGESVYFSQCESLCPCKNASKAPVALIADGVCTRVSCRRQNSKSRRRQRWRNFTTRCAPTRGTSKSPMIRFARLWLDLSPMRKNGQRTAQPMMHGGRNGARIAFLTCEWVPLQDQPLLCQHFLNFPCIQCELFERVESEAHSNHKRSLKFTSVNNL